MNQNEFNKFLLLYFNELMMFGEVKYEKITDDTGKIIDFKIIPTVINKEDKKCIKKK